MKKALIFAVLFALGSLGRAALVADSVTNTAATGSTVNTGNNMLWITGPDGKLHQPNVDNSGNLGVNAQVQTATFTETPTANGSGTYTPTVTLTPVIVQTKTFTNTFTPNGSGTYTPTTTLTPETVVIATVSGTRTPLTVFRAQDCLLASGSTCTPSYTATVQGVAAPVINYTPTGTLTPPSSNVSFVGDKPVSHSTGSTNGKLPVTLFDSAGNAYTFATVNSTAIGNGVSGAHSIAYQYLYDPITNTQSRRAIGLKPSEALGDNVELQTAGNARAYANTPVATPQIPGVPPSQLIAATSGTPTPIVVHGAAFGTNDTLGTGEKGLDVRGQMYAFDYSPNDRSRPLEASRSITSSGFSASSRFLLDTFSIGATLQNGSLVPISGAIIFNSITCTAAGNTAIFTAGMGAPNTSLPSGKKWRLLGYSVSFTGHATMAGAGTETVTFQDGTTSMPTQESFYLPAVALNAFGNYTNPFRPLQNGILSATADNALNVNLGTALNGGLCQVNIVATYE